MSTPKPVVLCILDGWGLRDDPSANAVALGDTPTFDHLMATAPNATLVTHGPDVGLPAGQMGNSEVGHTNIGAGRVVWMDLPRIDNAIEEGRFANKPRLVEFAQAVNAAKGRAHVIALVSDGGVHGHIDHLVAAAKALLGQGVQVIIHALTDGRDVGPKTAEGFITDLQSRLPDGASIASVSGRYFAMDRDNRWDRVGRAYDAMARGKGERAPVAAQAVTQAYSAGQTDEFIPPTVIGDYDGMRAGDGIFCLNFRADRAREIMAAFADPDFAGFDVADRPAFSAILGMVEYSDRHNVWMASVFERKDIPNTLGAWVAAHGKRQFRIAETEKYPHVTFFLNGGQETPATGEDRFMPPSPKVATYDLAPEMSAEQVTEHLLGAIHDRYDLIVVNFANPDMVGHTGDLQAAMAAVAEVDHCLSRVVDAVTQEGGAMIVTADHGNCETMVDPETGGPHTAHTTNPVPVILVGGPKGATLHDGRLADLAPTLLTLMHLPIPPEMTGESLMT